MADSFKVSVVKYPDREYLVFRWRDPITGKWRCKSAQTSRRRDAERQASNLEKEILEGQHGPAARMSWSDFREHHERHCLSALKPKSADSYVCALNVYERFHKPDRVSDVSTARVTAWQTHLRTEGKSEATIANYTRHLKSVLRWAHSQGLLAIVPKLAMPKRAKATKVMKGRPITTEEFERMLAAVPKVVVLKPAKKANGARKLAADPAAEREKVKYAKAVIESWKFYLRGLWWSGLRLRESLALEWTSTTPGALVVDFTGRRPMLRIPGESEKGGKDRLLPMAPEFADFLQQVPAADRRGRLFKLLGSRYIDARMQGDWVSRVVCEIGRKARVVVDQRERRLVVDSRAAKRRPKPENAKSDKAKVKAEPDDGIKRKYASAHDLRRAFGLRWSARVMPAVLQQLMRHESIETTMRYYVGRDADAVADALWEAIAGKPESTKSGNIRPDSNSESAQQKPQTLSS
jgi:integrase